MFTRRALLLVLAFWLAVGLIQVAGGWLVAADTGREFGLIHVIRTVVIWSTWAPASLLVYLLVRRLPIDRKNWWHRVPVHAAGAAAVSLLLCLLVSGMMRTLPIFVPPDAPYPSQVRSMFARSVALDSVIYLAVFIAVVAVDASGRAASAKARIAELDRRLADARLQTLTMQIRPHFLANSLQTIAALIQQD